MLDQHLEMFADGAFAFARVHVVEFFERGKLRRMRENVLDQDKPRFLGNNVEALSLVFYRTVDCIGRIGLIPMRRVVCHCWGGQLQSSGYLLYDHYVIVIPSVVSDGIDGIPVWNGKSNRHQSMLVVLGVFTLAYSRRRYKFKPLANDSHYILSVREHDQSGALIEHGLLIESRSYLKP
ncbi:hypothetical protein ACFOZ7_06640 [Natribaculum luteum]|uniref:Uncharacterized protein n=1 Tax=Natribaculum luteum TaxID=1586232 RepID=A0ABD5NX79_9EURY